MCDPKRNFESESDFKVVWVSVRDAVDSLGA
jgi:hypothetical protein